MGKKFQSAISVAGRAVEYWGSQSISSDTSALFELVKNSRDADAKKMEITFENSAKPGGCIIVRDDGNGMSLDEVKSKWLVAGTNFKLQNTISKGGRRVWGEMGIGRFSCERLAKRTKMISYPKGNSEKIIMDFDWEKYKDPDITFEQVTHEGSIEDKTNPKEHGLELVLDDLNTKWDLRKIQKLRKDLGSYILPAELKGPDDFEIKINAPDYNLEDEDVESGVIKIAPLRMRAVFDGKKMEIKVYDVENKVKKWHERETIKYTDKTCGPFKFGLFFYPLDKSGETKWSAYYQEHLKDMEIRDFLKNHSGVYLYRDAAWMKPYGSSFDWLGLEGKRVQRRSKIGRSQVYGIVNISQDENPGIRPTAHREVLQPNQAFEDIKSILNEAIRDLENYRQEVKVSIPKPAEKTDVMADNNVAQITKLCKSKSSLTATDVKKIQQYATATKKYIEEFTKEKEDEDLEKADIRHHELSVTSIGLVTAYVAHEVTGSLDSSVQVLGDVRDMMETTDFSKSVPEQIVKQGFDWLGTLEQNTKKLVHFLSFVDQFSAHLASSKVRGGRATQVKIKDMWEMVANGLKYLTELKEIKVEYTESHKDLKIRFDRIDLESIFANLITNSFEALKTTKGGSGVIRLDASYLKENLVLKFSDNGRGIKLKDQEEVFEPFVTTHRTSDDIVYGHGLGLSIVREILRRHQGSIAVSSPGYFRPGSTFEIKIPSSKAKRVV